MSQIKGTNFKIYLDADVVAYLKSNSITRSTTEIDITNKESGENKETMPGTREFQCKCEGFIDSLTKNVLAYSTALEDTAWGNISVTVTDDSTTAPDGTATASTVVYNATSDALGQKVTIAVTNGQTYTASVWLKGTAGQTLNLILRSKDESQGDTLTVTLTAAWVRYNLSYTFSGTEDGVDFVMVRESGNTATTVYVYGPQVELSDIATTYQPTPRVFTKDLFDAIEAGTAYAASCDDKTATHRKYSGTAYIKNLSQDFPNDDAAQFSCDLMFTGTITTATN